MHIRVRALAVSAAVIATILVSSLFSEGVAIAQPQAPPKGNEKKYDKAQTQEIQALVKLVNDITGGQAAPTEFPVSWQNHFLKARDQRTFVPYSVTFPQGTLTQPSVAVYVRVIKRAGAAPAVATPPVAPADKDAKPARAEFPFEDVYFVDLKAPEGKDPYRVARALSVAPGDYDAYVVIRERIPGAGKKGAPVPKTSVIKQAISVPNYWNAELATSSVILADKVEPLTAPIPENQIAENPYTFGATKIIPAADNKKFAKKEELSIIFLIYNTTDANKKPDVTVEYNFHQKADGAEKFFNKTNPQAFNAETLPPQFDTAAGHQLVAGQSIPLASFPEGEFRLEIKVTDKISGKTVVQSVPFVVVQ
jgi:hypothetical protein